MEGGIGWCVPTPQDYDVVSMVAGCARAASALRLGHFSCPPGWVSDFYLWAEDQGGCVSKSRRANELLTRKPLSP